MMKTNVMDGMRAIAHIYVLGFHYYLMFVAEDQHNNPVIIKHLFRLSSMMDFSVFFVINGINSCRWLTRSIESGQSLVRVSIRFIVDRLALIIAITYLFYICFALFAIFIVKDVSLERALMDGLVSNLLFFSNYSSENNV